MNKKIKAFVKENRDTIIGGVIIGAVTVIGYKVGFRHCEYLTAKSLDKMMLANPGFKEVFDNALEVTKDAMKI